MPPRYAAPSAPDSSVRSAASVGSACRSRRLAGRRAGSGRRPARRRPERVDDLDHQRAVAARSARAERPLESRRRSHRKSARPLTCAARGIGQGPLHRLVLASDLPGDRRGEVHLREVRHRSRSTAIVTPCSWSRRSRARGACPPSSPRRGSGRIRRARRPALRWMTIWPFHFGRPAIRSGRARVPAVVGPIDAPGWPAT